ncbi:hypothetical protein [Paenibacillus sp. S150]|uniref:hypothetical protein n=1 Tax=Paenibacillus sp. S150 TaxID=2749826 RepID=UPI001C5A35BB|nr:hypothetical protein [Paenibacillus sp. S150]MBW4082982.1 hypothetical protein [Paenibacillus sp. S150]
MNTVVVKSQTPPPTHKKRFPLSLLFPTLGSFAIGRTEFNIMVLLPNIAGGLLYLRKRRAGARTDVYAADSAPHPHRLHTWSLSRNGHDCRRQTGTAGEQACAPVQSGGALGGY